jgi:hypothetical protein
LDDISQNLDHSGDHSYCFTVSGGRLVRSHRLSPEFPATIQITSYHDDRPRREQRVARDNGRNQWGQHAEWAEWSESSLWIAVDLSLKTAAAGSPLDFWVYLNGLPVEKKQCVLLRRRGRSELTYCRQLSAQILAQREAEDAELHALEQQRCKLAADLRSEDTT